MEREDIFLKVFSFKRNIMPSYTSVGQKYIKSDKILFDFSLTWSSQHYQRKATNFDLPILEQGGFFSMPHL